MPDTSVLTCKGPERRTGCGQPIAMAHRGRIWPLQTGEILVVDVRGAATIACRQCGAITTASGIRTLRASGRGEDALR